MTIDLALLILTIIAATWTVMARSLLKATMGLAIASALISVIIFRMNSPLAAVFELSVCAGLITAIFVSAISMTKPLTHKEILQASKDRLKRFIYLPIILVLMAVGIILTKFKPSFTAAPMLAIPEDVRMVLWNTRSLDLIGQAIILIAGALGVAILFEQEGK